MTSDDSRGLSEYIAQVASGSPTPGGGSVAAIVGALGAALGEMVINLTGGLEVDDNPSGMLLEARDRLMALRAAFTAAAITDEEAYAAYRAAASMPKKGDAAKSLRIATMQAALITATDVPLAIARAATDAAEILVEVARLGNPHLRSDAALGALLAETALRGALLNVRGNAAMLRDRQAAARYEVEADRLEAAGRAAAGRAYEIATGAVANDAFL